MSSSTSNSQCKKNQTELKKIMARTNQFNPKGMNRKAVGRLADRSIHTINAWLRPCGTAAHRHLTTRELDHIKNKIFLRVG